MLAGCILSKKGSRTRANLLLLLGACWVISIVALTPVKLAKTQINKIRLQGLRSLRHFVNEMRTRGWRKGSAGRTLHHPLSLGHFQKLTAATLDILLGLTGISRGSAKALCSLHILSGGTADSMECLVLSSLCWFWRAWLL